MTSKFAKSSIAAVAFVVLAASGNGASAQSANGRSGGAGSGKADFSTYHNHHAPTLVRTWVPQRRRQLPNNCVLQKWKHWDGEAFYYSVRTFCRDR